MEPMHAAIAAAADGLALLVERRMGTRLERFHVATRDGVALAFYRRVDSRSGKDSDLLAVLVDEVSPRKWEAPGASELRTGGSRAISMRPSERGDWIVAIYGSAPDGTSLALIDYEGLERRVSVVDGVYGLMLRSASEPEQTMVRPRVA